MASESLQQRLKQFALRCVEMQKQLSKENTSQTISRQLIRSSFSVTANDRAACKAQTKKAFVAKLSIALEEVDESVFRLEMTDETKLLPSHILSELAGEVTVLAKILPAPRRTAFTKLKA